MALDFVDLTIKTGSPSILDSTVQQLPGCVAVVVRGSWNGETCVLRVFAGEGFLRYALPQQGYGEIVEDTLGSRHVDGEDGIHAFEEDRF